MFSFIVCILTLHRAYSACNVPGKSVLTEGFLSCANESHKDFGTWNNAEHTRLCYCEPFLGICTNNTAIQAEIVDQHNAYRRAVEPTAADMLIMNWSDEVAASAHIWIDKCTLSHGPPSTRMLRGYELGENLFYASAPHSWEKVIAAWHSEVANYQYPKGSTNGRAIGHYTQVVWNSSYKVGCAAKLCSDDIYYYGCHYYRAGNFRRVPPYKTGPPCASCPNACENKLCTNPCPYINRYLNCPALKKQNGCNALVSKWCPAECKCNNEIIPIAKK